MRRFLVGLCVACVFLGALSGVASAQPASEFRLGFKALADQIPDVAGQPLENEHWGANGDSLQQTSTGLMAWRKADNWTAFTNGHTSWINGPRGVQSRLNTQRFEWEGGEQPMDRTQSVPAEPTPPAQVEVQVDMGVGVTAVLVCSGLVIEYPFVPFVNVGLPLPPRSGCQEVVVVGNTGRSTAVNVKLSEHLLDTTGAKAYSPSMLLGASNPFTLSPQRAATWASFGGATGGYIHSIDRWTAEAALAGKAYQRGYFVTWQWQHPDGSLSSEMRSPLFLTHTSGY